MNIRQSSTRLAFVLTIIALIAGFSACDQIQGLLIPATHLRWKDLSGEISVGLVLPITGRLASFGLPIQRGFELAVEEVNNSQLSDVKLQFII